MPTLLLLNLASLIREGSESVWHLALAAARAAANAPSLSRSGASPVLKLQRKPCPLAYLTSVVSLLRLSRGSGDAARWSPRR
jgi:hypothetical protein